MQKNTTLIMRFPLIKVICLEKNVNCWKWKIKSFSTFNSVSCGNLIFVGVCSLYEGNKWPDIWILVTSILTEIKPIKRSTAQIKARRKQMEHMCTMLELYFMYSFFVYTLNRALTFFFVCVYIVWSEKE